MSQRIRLTIKDAIAIYQEGVGGYAYDPETAHEKSYWFILPDSAVDGIDIRPSFREPCLEAIFGKGWRDANGDGGTKHLVLNIQPAVPTAREARRRPWETDGCPCFVLDERGRPINLEAGVM